MDDGTRMRGRRRQTPMSTVIRLADRRRRGTPVFFTRAELDTLLALYSRHVAKGDWRDYAIGQEPGLARFTVHRHTHERPLFTFIKLAPRAAGAKPDFVLFHGDKKARQSPNLQEILAVFDKKVQLL